MPSRRVHLKFDEYLRKHGIITEFTHANKVHDRMDRDTQRHGHWSHREIDYYHGEEGVREWLKKWQHLAYQETLTDYVRVALGHLLLDALNSYYEYDSEEELIKSAYRSFVQRGFHRAFFREK